jgi:hypothetical protein
MAAIDDLVTYIKSGVQNLGVIAKTMSSAFPQQTGTTTSATGGSASTLPSTPAGYINVTLQNGTAVKVPYYNP